MSKWSRRYRFRAGKVLMLASLAIIAAIGWFGGKQFEYSSSLSAAQKAWAKGNAQQTIANARLALDSSISNSDKSQAYYWLGVGYFNSRELNSAIACAQKAIALNPTYGEPHVTLGLIDVTIDNLTAARNEAGTAMKLSPAFGWDYNLLGIIDYESGHKSAAIADETKALHLDPGQTELKQNLKAFSK